MLYRNTRGCSAGVAFGSVSGDLPDSKSTSIDAAVSDTATPTRGDGVSGGDAPLQAKRMPQQLMTRATRNAGDMAEDAKGGRC